MYTTGISCVYVIEIVMDNSKLHFKCKLFSDFVSFILLWNQCIPSFDTVLHVDNLEKNIEHILFEWWSLRYFRKCDNVYILLLVTVHPTQTSN